MAELGEEEEEEDDGGRGKEEAGGRGGGGGEERGRLEGIKQGIENKNLGVEVEVRADNDWPERHLLNLPPPRDYNRQVSNRLKKANDEHSL